MKRIYLDYAASTPVAPEVEKTMRIYFSKKFGNPGSTHWFGQETSAAIFEAREKIAKAIGVDYKQIIFTASATEANNLALRGVVSGKIVVSAIEHNSVMETCSSRGNCVYIPVDKEGFVDLKKLKSALNKKTVLVSVIYASNEIGVVQPIKEISKIIRNFRGNNIYPLFHTDAVQAFQFLKCNVDELGVDLMTLSAHKIYGPKGMGLLYVRNKKLISPIVTGGGQEWGLRSGTENVPYIVGFGKAVELAESLRLKESGRLRKLRDYFWKELKKIVPKVELNGPIKNRLANNLNVYFPGRPAQDLCLELDIWGVSVSPGVACSVRSAKPSYIIQALGYSGDRPYSSIRFSLGRWTTKKEIDDVLRIFRKRFS